MSIVTYYEGLTATAIIGRLLIVGFFLFFFVKNVSIWSKNAEMVGEILPFPNLSLAFGFVFEFLGSAMVLLGFHPRIGAILLIIFTVAASVLFLRFWTIKEPEKRHLYLVIFCNNVAIIGGLIQMM